MLQLVNKVSKTEEQTFLVSIPAGPRGGGGGQLRVIGGSVRWFTPPGTDKKKYGGVDGFSGQTQGLIWMPVTHRYAASRSILAGRHVVATGQRNPDKLDYWIDCHRLLVSFILDASKENGIKLII